MTRRVRHLWTVIRIAVAVAGAVGWLLHLRSVEVANPAAPAVNLVSPPGDAASRSEVDSIRGLLGQYDQGLGDLGQVQWQQAERIAALEKRLAETLAAEAAQPSAPEEPDPTELEARAREQFARGVQLARTEPVDAGWSEHAEQQLEHVFRAEKLAGSALQRAECHSTLCLAEVLHDDEAAHDAFVSNFPGLVDWAFDARLEVDREHGKPSTRMLITREGATLPQ